MATKIWTSDSDFESGILSGVSFGRVSGELQLGGSWATGGDLNTARAYSAGCGTQTAGLCFGGDSGGTTATTEEYDGTSWNSGGDLNTARKGLAGCGTQTAGLSFGGSGPSAVTEEYNGSCWSSGGDLNTARLRLSGCGTQTAGLSIGGYIDAAVSITEEYNGTCWSSAADLNTARDYLAGCGTQTAGLSFGGADGGTSAVTEEYNGSSWSSGGDLNTAQYRLAGAGTQTAGLSFGGAGPAAATEEYNGSLWCSGGDLNTARQYLGGCGIQTAALSFGGSGPSEVTEEYNTVLSGTWIVDFDSGYDPTVWGSTIWDNLGWTNAGGGSVKARVKSAISQANLDGAIWYPTGGSPGSWGLGGNLNTANWKLAGCGTQTAGLSFGGTGTSAITEEYNGTSWSSGGDLNTARESLAGCGTQTAGLSFGGNGPSAITEEYNGSCWSSGGDLNTARYSLAGCGTQTAGLSSGGTDGTAVTEEYNGSCWSSGGDLNTARDALAGAGTQTAGLSFGGYVFDYDATTEEYNGSCWSSGGDLNTARRYLAGCGTQTAGLSFGGADETRKVETEEYDGTLWSSGGNLNTAKFSLGGCGTQTGLSFGGFAASASATTEEYRKYYTTQPVDVECPDNRWYRLELTLIEGSTPEVQQVGQDYRPPWPTITGNGNVYIVYPNITGNGRIKPSISANGRIQPSISADGRIRPVISADGRIQPTIGASAEIVYTIEANGKIICSRQFGDNWQRKSWRLAPYFWRSRYDIVNSRLVFEYIHEDQLDGDNWAENTNARIDASGFNGIDADFTVRGSENGIKTTIHYSDGTDTYVSEADDEVTNPITWSWANTTKVFDGVSDSCDYQQVNLAINRATIPYFHATAVFDDGTNYYVRDKEQTVSGDITGWDAADDVSSNTNTTIIYGSSVRAIGITGVGKNDMMFVWKEGGHLKGRFYDGSNWGANAEQTIDATADSYKAKFDLEHCLVAGCVEALVIYIDATETIHWSTRDAGPNSSESWSSPVQLCSFALDCQSVGIVDHGTDGLHYALWIRDNKIEYREWNDVGGYWHPPLAQGPHIWDPSSEGVVNTTTISQLTTPDSVGIINSVLINWIGKIGADDCEIGWGIFEEGKHLGFIGAEAWVTGPGITADARIQPSIDADGRIQPSIGGNGRIKPSISSTARIQPSICANGEICLNIPLDATARIRPSITATGRIIPTIPAVGRITPSIPCNARIGDDKIGKVYTIGGYDSLGYSSKNECIDPFKNTWTNKAPLVTPRTKIAVATDEFDFYAFGGLGLPNGVDKYYPESDSWVSKGNMTHSLYSLGAVGISICKTDFYNKYYDKNLKSYIHALGGKDSITNLKKNYNSEYDPDNDTWVVKTPIPANNAEAGCGAINNEKIYVSGGESGLNTNYEYNPLTESWSVKHTMITGRHELTATGNTDFLFTFGGNNSVGESQNVTEKYNPIGNIWISETPAVIKRGKATSSICVEDYEKIIVAGGLEVPADCTTGQPTQLTESYDVAADSWVTKTNMPTGRMDLASGFIRGVKRNIVYRSISGRAKIAPSLKHINTRSIVKCVRSAYSPPDYNVLIVPAVAFNRTNVPLPYGFEIDPGVWKQQISASATINKNTWSTDLLITANARIRPNLTAVANIVRGITANACIYHVYIQYAVGRITPIIKANGQIKVEVEKTITGNAFIGTALQANAKVLNLRIRSKARIRPVLTALTRIQPSLKAKARIRPIIKARAWIKSVWERLVTANGRIRPVITAIGKIIPSISGNARIQPTISSDGSVIVLPILPANAYILTELMYVGKMYVTGGWRHTYDNRNAINEVYDIIHDSWSAKQSMPSKRAQHGMGSSILQVKLYSIGGAGTEKENIEYNPDTDAWTAKAQINPGRKNNAVVNVCDFNGYEKIFTIGGRAIHTGLELNNMDEYDPATDSWVVKANISPATDNLSAGTIAFDKVYVSGGEYGLFEGIKNTQEYDPETNIWTIKANLNVGRQEHTSSGNAVNCYCFDGMNSLGKSLNSTEQYQPFGNFWLNKTAGAIPRDRIVSECILEF